MAAIFSDNSQAVGNTPIVRLSRLAKGLAATLLAKVEGRNPAFSVKDRVGLAMIHAAEKSGRLIPGSGDTTIVEPTSGNTGIALAAVAAARGYPIILTMPETMSIERRRLLASLGAELLLTEGPAGIPGAIRTAEELVASDPKRYFMPQQFKNPANPEIHFNTTGPEIWRDTDGQAHCFVCGIGTGGTITGAGRFLKGMNPSLRIVGVEPAGSAVLTAIKAGLPPKPGPHLIQGIGAGFKPDTLDLDLVDEIMPISNEEALDTARQLFKMEGISCGISSGAAAAAALRLAGRPEFTGKNIVVVLPDLGERYLSTKLFV